MGYNIIWEVRKDLTGKDSFEHRVDGHKAVSHKWSWGEGPRPREPQVQRPEERVCPVPWRVSKEARVAGAE